MDQELADRITRRRRALEQTSAAEDDNGRLLRALGILMHRPRSFVRDAGERINEQFHRGAIDVAELLRQDRLAANLRAGRELAREYYGTRPETAEANPYRIPAQTRSLKARRMAALVRSNNRHRLGR